MFLASENSVHCSNRGLLPGETFDRISSSGQALQAKLLDRIGGFSQGLSGLLLHLLFLTACICHCVTLLQFLD